MKWTDPLDEMRKMQAMIDSAFSDFFARPAPPTGALAAKGMSWREPLCNMWEDEGNVSVTIEIPGVPKENIKLNVKDNELEIRAESRKEKKEVKKDSRVFERTYAGFYRLIPLPAEVDASKTNATYNHGVLEVKMPKAQHEKRKGIEIKVN